MKNFLRLTALTVAMFMFWNVHHAQKKLSEVKVPGGGDTLKCRCHGSKCYGGNHWSLRKNCANFPGGTGDCSAHSKNCVQ